MALLGRTPLLGGLAREAVEALMGHATVRTFPRNAILFCEEEPATHFYVILAGWVKLFRSTEDGDESVIAVFARGESFAEAAIFDRGIYPVTAAVIADSRLLVVPAEPFVRGLSARGDIALKMMASMSRHLRQLVQQIERLTNKSSTERVAAFLLKLCAQDSGPATILLPLDKALIAGRLGMQPETLSRSFAKLRTLGVITRGGEISIPDVAALRHLSRGHAPPR